jgi:hypothetical protein
VQYLRAAARVTQETLATISPEASTYDSRGNAGDPKPGAHLFDGNL